MAEKKRSLGATLLLIAAAALIWFAQSKGWLPESDSSDSGGGPVATAPERSDGDRPRSPSSEPSRQAEPSSPEQRAEPEDDDDFEDGADEIVKAARYQRSGFMVTTRGVVKKSLRDDNEGHRHQRFIVRLENSHTVLVAHNIDLAPRVPLEEGDTVIIFGQYEWNDQGGVLHWTHHDPQKRREGGWIKHDGKLYE